MLKLRTVDSIYFHFLFNLFFIFLFLELRVRVRVMRLCCQISVILDDIVPVIVIGHKMHGITWKVIEG